MMRLLAVAPFLLLHSVSSLSTSLALPKPGIWGYFCYEDTASIDGSSPKGFYSAQCWREWSVRNPSMVGTLMMVKWRHIEPKDGVYDWAALDANITKAAKLKLQLILFIEICKATPHDSLISLISLLLNPPVTQPNNM